MKVKDLIKQLQQTKENNEVRILSQQLKANYDDTTPNLYLSFDDLGDVLIYEVEE